MKAILPVNPSSSNATPPDPDISEEKEDRAYQVEWKTGYWNRSYRRARFSPGLLFENACAVVNDGGRMSRREREDDQGCRRTLEMGLESFDVPCDVCWCAPLETVGISLISELSRCRGATGSILCCRRKATPAIAGQSWFRRRVVGCGEDVGIRNMFSSTSSSLGSTVLGPHSAPGPRIAVAESVLAAGKASRSVAWSG